MADDTAAIDDPSRAIGGADLAEAIPDGVVIVRPDGLIDYANGRLLAMTGYAAGELVGQPVEVLVPERMRDRHPAHRARYTQAPVPRPMGTNLSIQCRRRDGSSFDADIALSPMLRERSVMTVATVRDVTERRRADRAQRELEERFRLLVESVENYAIILLSPEGTISSWNAGATRMHGYMPGEIIGTHFSIFYPSEDIVDDVPGHLLEQARSSGRAEASGWRVRRDGSRFYASVSITPVIDHDGALLGYAKVVRDETVRREARERRLRIQLLEQRERIARDLHDGVIQRIFAVGMGLQALASLETSAELKARIESGIDELDSVIGDLRRYIFGLRDEESAETMNLQIQEMAADLERSYGVVPALEIEPAALGQLRARSNDVMMLLQEALSNVGRHASASTVRVAAHVARDGIELVVDDDGEGFDPSLNTPGFGLSNMRQRAEELMGSISFQSAPGEGCTVRILLPAQAS